MKLWRLCILVLLFSGLCIGPWLAGCCGDDNPCELASPDTCALISDAAPNTCVVIEEDDFACKCCDTALDEPCDPPYDEGGLPRCYRWDEATHSCIDKSPDCG
jgi:hypothetical protein